MSVQDEVMKLIREHRGELVREGHHQVYRFPSGAVFTLSKTPSDRRQWLNALSDLKKVLGVKREKKEPRKQEGQAHKDQVAQSGVTLSERNLFLESVEDVEKI